MRDSAETSWPRAAFGLARLGGVFSGIGLTVLTVSGFGALSHGVAPRWAFYAVIVAGFVGAAVLAFQPRTPRLRLAGMTLGVTAIVLLPFGLVGWELPYGDYFWSSPMRRVLRNAVQWQDDHRDRTGRYAPSVPDEASRSVEVRLSQVVTPGGWAATARHPRTARVCTVFLGSTPLPPAKVERIPRCSRGAMSASAVLWGVGLLLGGVILGEVAHRRRRFQAAGLPAQ